MSETLASQPTQPATHSPSDEVLKLKCPRCGGALHLKRKFLGSRGRCVHCQASLSTREENGVARLEAEAAEDSSMGEGSGHHLPGIDVAPAAVPLASTTEYAAPLPTRLGDNLFPSPPPPLAPPEGSGETRATPSPFGGAPGFPSSPGSLFGASEETGSIQPAWGVKVPKESHASISPFATQDELGSSFADSLFRTKAEKEIATSGSGVPSSFASPFVPAAPKAAAPSEAAAPARDRAERVILDGDGRPMRPMTPEEEEEFAKNFFRYENSRTKPRWAKRILRKLKRILVGFCLLAGIAAVAACFVPKEKLHAWRQGAIEWLEPGMAIFDYLPEKLRPKWLPQSKFGIDGGLDETGRPKKKMNAFEGLDKLKGDVGNMRKAADAQLKELENF